MDQCAVAPRSVTARAAQRALPQPVPVDTAASRLADTGQPRWGTAVLAGMPTAAEAPAAELVHLGIAVPAGSVVVCEQPASGSVAVVAVVVVAVAVFGG